MISQPENPQHISRLTPLPELLEKLSAVDPVEAKEVEPALAVGSTLAVQIAAPHDMPAAAVALRDGWAVNSSTLTDAGPYAPVPLDPAPLWVDAGEAMPGHADAVLPFDAVKLTARGSESLAPVVPGEGVLVAGQDAGKGTVLRHAGGILRASDVAVLRALGIAKVPVRSPRVHIFSVNVPTRSATDTITPVLARAVEAAGGMAQMVQSASLETALADNSYDMLVSVGGTGSGRNDAAVRTLARIGSLHAHGLGISPGESAAFGSAGKRPVLMLPGRLDAALAVFLVLGREVVARLAGRRVDDMATPVKLLRKITSTIGLAEMIPLRLAEGGAEPLAGGVLPLAALSTAHGWMLVPPQSEGFAVGSVVEMRPLP